MHQANSWVEIVGDLAHELRTPLASAAGFVDLLRNCGDPLTARQERFADRALEAMERMEHLVARLLEVAWIDEERPLEPKRCDLAVMIEHAVTALSDFADRRKVGVHAEVDSDVGSIEADERRLDQVMLNLLSNAIKYNHPQGDVWVRATGTVEGIEVTVRDNGRGISPQALPHVFDRFFRDQSGADRVEGTGLGLAIVKALVEKHGGHIWVESRVGEGSSFTFVMPRVLRLSEGHDVAREVTNVPVERAESQDFLGEGSNEEIDAVEDNLQEPPEISGDRDESDLAERQ